MSSKKKGGKKKGNKNAVLDELRTMIEALKSEMDKMNKTIKKQSKRISSLESDNKRFAKTLNTIQSNQSSANQLLSLPNSMTTATDNEQSDAETKENTETNPKAKAKAVLRRNRVKPKKKASDIRFTFDMAHQKIKQGDNGASAMKPKVYGGTIRFGRFLHFTKNNSDNIASFTLAFDTRSIGQNATTALGFATKSFQQWVGSNFGQNNSCLIKGNSQFLTTDRIFKLIPGKEYKHKQTVEELKNPENPKNGFFKDGDAVKLEVDLKNGIGRIWNDTWNKDRADQSKVFEIGLPSDYEICVVAYLGGGAKKRLTVSEQKIVLNE